MGYQDIKKECFGQYCRQCINREKKKNLKSSDCIYLIYPHKCTCCGEVKNIVSGIRRASILKLIF